MNRPRLIFLALFAALTACGSADSADSAPPAPRTEKAPPPQPREPAVEAPTPNEPAPSNTPTWCSKQGAHSFCADFDGADPKANWATFGAASAVGITASDRSAPNALSITRPAAGGDSGLVKLVSKLAPQNIRIAMDIRVDSRGLTGNNFYQQPIVIQVADAAGERVVEGLALELRTDGSKVETGLQLFSLEEPEGLASPTSVEVAPATTLPTDRWVRVAIAIDLSSASTLRASLAYDGVGAGEISVKRAPAELARVYLNVGASIPYAAVGPAPFVAAFDNVLFDVD